MAKVLLYLHLAGLKENLPKKFMGNPVRQRQKLFFRLIIQEQMVSLIPSYQEI